MTAHSRLTREQMYETLWQVRELPADTYAVNLGISCEACHNGCASHVANERELPAFFSIASQVHLEDGDRQFILQRNSVNSNWVCSRCHAVDQTIDWTLGYLEDWYQADSYSAAKIAANYPERDKPAAIGWLTSPHHGTRLVAADALIRADARWAIKGLLEVLDDPYLVNRQFTARNLGKMHGIDPRDYGYRFYMQKDERAEPLLRLRDLLTAE